MLGLRWQQIRSLFLDASELPRSERTTFLVKECGADAALRAEVEHLLESSQSAAPGFLEPPGIARGIFADLARPPE